MNLFCVGLSHHTANVETRENFVGSAESECLLRQSGCSEVLLLATCNRVEVYGASHKRVSTEEIARCLARKIDKCLPDHVSAFYRYEEEQCAQHLFRVASGVDSMVVGETEVFGQVKKAYESARNSGAAGPNLHRLFQRAFRVGKQVRSRTELTRGAVSVGSVAVDLAQRIFGNLARCKVLLLGAGENSERTARALISRGVSDLYVSNRSGERAMELTKLIGGLPIPFEQWRTQCRKIDILVTSTSSDEPLLKSEDLAPLLSDRVDRPLFIIDIAVPRDVDPAVNKMEGVYLYDIDSLQSVAEQSLALRRQQVAEAERIIAEHLDDFWQKSFGEGAGSNREVQNRSGLNEGSLRPSEL